MNTYCITTIETVEHVYRIAAATEDEALLMLKTEFHDSDYDIIDEKLKSIKLEKGEE